MQNKNASILHEEHQILIQDIKAKFIWGLGARYVLIALAVILIYLAVISGAYLHLSIGLVSFVIIYNFAAHLIIALKKHFLLWQIITLGFFFQILDIASITFVIYITGWVESPYWFLYLVLIVISGFGMFSSYSFSVFLIAFFSAFFYLGLLLAAYFGLLPVYGPGLSLSPQEMLNSISNKAVFTTVSFMLFSLSIYYFSKLLNDQRQELTEKNKQLLIAVDKLKDVDRMKDEFVSTASHELRTPLSVIRENMSLIEDGVVGQVESKQKDLLRISRENADRLAGILDNLLDISKIESRSLELDRENNDLIQVVRTSIELLSSKAAQKNIHISTQMPEYLNAWIDADQILRVLINLIDNALKNTQENGKILVSVHEKEKEIECFVRDNGPGVSSGDMPKIFERFVSIKNGSAVKGTGLGLSICRGIVELHDGKIWAESSEGQGAKFVFTLPKV